MQFNYIPLGWVLTKNFLFFLYVSFFLHGFVELVKPNVLSCKPVNHFLNSKTNDQMEQFSYIISSPVKCPGLTPAMMQSAVKWTCLNQKAGWKGFRKRHWWCQCEVSFCLCVCSSFSHSNESPDLRIEFTLQLSCCPLTFNLIFKQFAIRSRSNYAVVSRKSHFKLNIPDALDKLSVHFTIIKLKGET